MKVDSEAVTAIRTEKALIESKLNALVAIVREMVRERGNVSAETVSAFFKAGYQKVQVLELLIAIAMKTITNYLNHISPVELNETYLTER